MFLDLTEELARLLQADPISIVSDEVVGDLDGGGKVLVCKGDLPQGCSIRGARALIVEGAVTGGLESLCEIVCEDTVIILGDIFGAHISAPRVIVGKNVENAFLQIFNTAEIHGNVKKTQFHLGVPTTRAETILARSRNLQELKSTQGDLKQQVESARRSLDKLLKVTGVVFNLNLGRIVRQSEVGLQIDLSSFYKALPGRSAAEVDTALRQFFAKAVMGLLTRLNRDYIASGRGHQVRFKSVVAKLQDLVLKSREYDKCVHMEFVSKGSLRNVLIWVADGQIRWEFRS
ncbi:MAG: hypothetical protein HN521_15080 [Candidatus Latescibacteria bacterium]|nr:hypothetical protein [Candidatus Latescibacterota bacterium]